MTGKNVRFTFPGNLGQFRGVLRNDGNAIEGVSGCSPLALRRTEATQAARASLSLHHWSCEVRDGMYGRHGADLSKIVLPST